MFFNAILALSVTVALGCHPRNTGKSEVEDIDNADVGGGRTKRELQNYSPFSPSLEEFFSNCLGPYQGLRNLDIRTVVDYSIEQSIWFQKSDQQFCRSDTVRCWQNILFRYLNLNSGLFRPTSFCIQQYGYYRNGSNSQETTYLNPAFLYPARRRQVVSSAPVNEENFAVLLRQALPSFQGNVRTLVEFFKNDVICSPGICTCEGLTLPPGEYCGENWYTRIAAMTRVDSPIRQSLIRATNTALTAAIQQQRQVQQRLQRQRQRQLVQIVQIWAISQALMQSTTTPVQMTTIPTTIATTPIATTPIILL